MFGRKKSFDEIAEELDAQDRKNGVAMDYDRIKDHPSDNAYLYYIHHRVGWTNKLLQDIKSAIWISNALLASGLGYLWHKFGVPW
ncbi:hypothetical protein [Rhizobium laguerreae]|uniref:hypothetical protein n=1 Tax=Rhizobium laguerreae TaxID=1076926 RepID=UPI001A8EC35B|nr:hypothetical protein [Rhizobium laguerreae]MBN9983099.1 hypothetical protein [Rhizobium laguerreae]MBY3127396.1 hypothetical protein [Rhizobium laguerreae]MBY3250182.1 hypothetical protein [Rhizobium laguerreae]